MSETNPLNPPLPREHWLNRLRYRSWHRGSKETDLILGHYCDQNIESLSDAELTRYEQFLDEDDGDIWNWVTGKTECLNATYQPLLAALRTITLPH